MGKWRMENGNMENGKINLSMFQSFNLSMFQSFNLSMFQSFNLSMFQSFNLSMFQSFYTACILTPIFCNFVTISSYPLAMISSFMIFVVHCAMIQARTIAPPHLRSVEETYPPLNLFGPMTIASCGLRISILAHRFSNSVR